jgi:hypothetical protein
MSGDDDNKVTPGAVVDTTIDTVRTLVNGEEKDKKDAKKTDDKKPDNKKPAEDKKKAMRDTFKGYLDMILSYLPFGDTIKGFFNDDGKMDGIMNMIAGALHSIPIVGDMINSFLGLEYTPQETAKTAKERLEEAQAQKAELELTALKERQNKTPPPPGTTSADPPPPSTIAGNTAPPAPPSPPAPPADSSPTTTTATIPETTAETNFGTLSDVKIGDFLTGDLTKAATSYFFNTPPSDSGGTGVKQKNQPTNR